MSDNSVYLVASVAGTLAMLLLWDAWPRWFARLLLIAEAVAARAKRVQR